MKAILVLAIIAASACKGPPEGQPSRYERGRQVFQANCMQCHGDPKVGSFGPPNYGSSLPLIRSKVLKGEYPDGYVPKKQTKMMPQFNLPDNDLLALYCYLNDKCKVCSRKGSGCDNEEANK